MPLYPEAVNQTGLIDMFNYAENVSGGIFYTGILFTLYLIIWLYLLNKGEDWSNAAIVAGFITSISAVFLFVLGKIQGVTLVLQIILLGMALIASFVSKD